MRIIASPPASLCPSTPAAAVCAVAGWQLELQLFDNKGLSLLDYWGANRPNNLTSAPRALLERPSAHRAGRLHPKPLTSL